MTPICLIFHTVPQKLVIFLLRLNIQDTEVLSVLLKINGTVNSEGATLQKSYKFKKLEPNVSKIPSKIKVACTHFLK